MWVEIINQSRFLTVYTAVLIGLLGACMGSFLHCTAWRIVHGESAFSGRSHCDKCGHTLNFFDLIPVFGYIFNKGRCRYCKEKISVKHLVYELISAICFVFVFIRFNISLQVIEYICFVSILLACSFADLEGYIIPDRFIVTGFLVRIVFILTEGDAKADIINSLIGAAAVSGVLLAIVLIFEAVTKKEAMGGGDIKLIAMCGWFLGWQRNILCLFLSCLTGIIFGIAANARRNEDGESALFPWGPSIAIAAFISAMFGSELIASYLGLFNI